MGETWTYQLDAEYSFDDPYATGLVRKLQAQLTTANEARQQLQDALHVRDTQLAAATQRAQVANQYALGMEEAANAVRAQNAALLQEIAGLRYYIAQLERNVSREDRAYAAEVASLMFAQHDSDSAQPRE
jgi:hypothetical protein